MAEHSILPPSSAARRNQCTASTMLEARYPQPESPEAVEGTTAHWAVAESLAGRLVDVGDLAPTGQYLTAEMIEASDLMFDDVSRELALYGLKPEQGVIEQAVRIPRVHAQSWGTPDYRIWLQAPPRRPRLLLYDFKFGHRFVEVFENDQCIEYVAGVLEELPHGLTDMEVDVTVKIVQPRAYHKDGSIRAWHFKGSDIRALVNIASYSAHEALSDTAVTRVGPECRDCQARHACPTLQAAAMTACDVAGAAQPFDLPVAAMALEYRVLQHYRDLLRARSTGLEEQLLALGRTGQAIPGLRIEHGAGRERWTLPDAQVIAAAAMLGVDIAKAPEVMTPKQAVKAGLPSAMLAGLVNTPRGEAKLVTDDGSMARRIFG